METLIGKKAEIKSDVVIDKSDELTRSHGIKYQIINESRKTDWICLESICKVHLSSLPSGRTEDKTINRSFWLETDKCIIYEE